MNHVSLTKIVATVGPASSSPETIDALIDAGVDVFRLNFSHGTHADHRRTAETIRAASARKGQPIGIMQDLQGIKLRVGDLVGDGPVTLEEGAEFRICTQAIEGDATRVSTTYEPLARDVQPGDTILLDDGRIELRAERAEFGTNYGDEVITSVIHGGELLPRKGINLPGTAVTAPSLTPKDLDDLRLGIALGVDLVALSFVRTARDLHEAREQLRELGGTQPLIAKIEKPQAVDQLEDIVRAADGVMVARGDLGVEMPLEAVPLIQKRLILLANQRGIPVITATQMLESMIENPRPTRAEVSDVAYAVFDGSDAVMLSGETAIGEYPVETVALMRRIAQTVEGDQTWRDQLRHESPDAPISKDAVAAAQAATKLAESIGACAIAVLTETGLTARRVSQARPGIPIVAVTEHEHIARRLTLWHGIVPVVDPLDATIEGLLKRVEHHVRQLGIAGSGQSIVIVGAVPRTESNPSVFLEISHLE
jgi:pyruvate kinase